MTSFLFSVLSSFLLLSEHPAINRSLQKEEWEFVRANLPILIVPAFANRRDNLIAFDLGRRMTDENGNPLGTFDPGQNAKAYLQLKETSPGEIDFDLVEIGGALSLNVLLARPQNFPTPRGIDAESGIIVFEKEKIGPTAENGFKIKNFVALGNAHGAAMAAAGNAEKISALPPAHWASQKYGFLSLENFIQTQAMGTHPRGRIADLLDGRVVFVSEPRTHALTPVSSIDQLLRDIDITKAVVYVLNGASQTDTQNRLKGATILPYRIRDEELSSVLIPRHSEIVAGNSLIAPPTVMEGWYPDQKVQLVSDIPTEFRNSLGQASGANGYWGWAITECVKDGERYEPENFKDAPRRAHAVSLGHLVSEGLFGFFSAEQIAAGALKPIRNSWMKESAEQ